MINHGQESISIPLTKDQVELWKMSQQGTTLWTRLGYSYLHKIKPVKKFSMVWGGIPEALPNVKESMAVEGAGIGGVTFLEVCGL